MNGTSIRASAVLACLLTGACGGTQSTGEGGGGPLAPAERRAAVSAFGDDYRAFTTVVDDQDFQEVDWQGVAADVGDVFEGPLAGAVDDPMLFLSMLATADAIEDEVGLDPNYLDIMQAAYCRAMSGAILAHERAGGPLVVHDAPIAYSCGAEGRSLPERAFDTWEASADWLEAQCVALSSAIDSAGSEDERTYYAWEREVVAATAEGVLADAAVWAYDEEIADAGGAIEARLESLSDPCGRRLYVPW